MSTTRHASNDSIRDYFQNLEAVMAQMPQMLETQTGKSFAEQFDELISYDRRSMFLYLLNADYLPPKEARAYVCYKFRRFKNVNKLRRKYGLPLEE